MALILNIREIGGKLDIWVAKLESWVEGQRDRWKLERQRDHRWVESYIDVWKV